MARKIKNASLDSRSARDALPARGKRQASSNLTLMAIFLAKALASESSLKELEDLWFDEGDIEKLPNDRGFYAGLSICTSKPSVPLV
jgi:hypothetical protein